MEKTACTITHAMVALLREIEHRPNIQLLTGHTAVDLLTSSHHARDPLAVYYEPVCYGAYIANVAQRNNDSRGCHYWEDFS